MIPPPFLRAEWRDLAMLSYEIDPAALAPHAPEGTEPDLYRGRAYASVVGFRFLRTRIGGIAVPFHGDFEEVNLRFYVRRRAKESWLRGVVFVRELVPRRAVAFVARWAYGEPYTALPMRRRIDRSPDSIRCEYGWTRDGKDESIRAEAAGAPAVPEAGSLASFLVEQTWGFTPHRTGTRAYRVEHPPWRVWSVARGAFHADAEALYGPPFADALSRPPDSALIAEGSPVSVGWRSG